MEHKSTLLQNDDNSGKANIADQSTASSKIKLHFDIQLLLTIAGAIGIAAIFLDFSWSTSPYDLILSNTSLEYWWIALPAILPVLVFFASLRWLFSQSVSKTEHSIAWLFGILGALTGCFTLYRWIKDIGVWPDEIKERFSIILPIVTLGLGFYILVKTRRNTFLNPFRSILCMQIAYIASSLLFLISYWDGWQNNSTWGLWGGWHIGAYCFLITVLIYLTQIALIVSNALTNGTSTE